MAKNCFYVDSIDENPILKEKGVKIGNLSQYLPKEDFELTPEQKQLANSTIKEKTGFSVENAETIKNAI